MGRFFERLIKSEMLIQNTVLKNASVTYEELYTVLTEIKATLNARPLTVVPTKDLDEPITPSNLMIGRSRSSLPDASKPKEESRIEEMNNSNVVK